MVVINMAKYKKRKDGRYATTVTVSYDTNGKRKQRTIYGKTIRELDDKLAEIKSQLNKGIVIDDEGLTVGEWAEQWLNLYKADVEHNTLAMYRNAVDKHIKKALGSLRLSALKTSHVQGLINSLSDKPRTAEVVKLTMSQMIKQAIVSEYIYKDMMAGVKLPKKQKPQKRALTDIEKKIVTQAELDIKSRAFIDVLYYTGIRRGEALALTVRDVDLKAGELHISKTLIFKGNNSEIKDSPKSDAGNRTIPIPQPLRETLKKYMATLDGVYLFPKQKSAEPMTHGSFVKFWNNIRKQLVISDKDGNKISLKDSGITPHIFRHTYATSLYYGGVDLKTAQYLLGHSSIQVTMDIYTHLDNSGIKSAAEKLETLYKNSAR